VAALRQTTRVCIDHATKSNHRRFIVTLMVEALGTNARLSEPFRDMMRRFRAFLGGIIELGQNDGTFRRDISAAAAASTFASTVMGAEIQYYQDPDEIDLEGTLEVFLGQYVASLMAPKGGVATQQATGGGS
jgi:hypothetical protein